MISNFRDQELESKIQLGRSKWVVKMKKTKGGGKGTPGRGGGAGPCLLILLMRGGGRGIFRGLLWGLPTPGGGGRLAGFDEEFAGDAQCAAEPARDGNAAEQPIYLTAVAENPNGAKLLMLCDGAEPPAPATLTAQGFDLVCTLFNGQDDEALSAARASWRSYKAAQQQLVYYQQDDDGAWVEKARH